jgi:hypothetical protein
VHFALVVPHRGHYIVVPRVPRIQGNGLAGDVLCLRPPFLPGHGQGKHRQCIGIMGFRLEHLPQLLLRQGVALELNELPDGVEGSMHRGLSHRFVSLEDTVSVREVQSLLLTSSLPLTCHIASGASSRMNNPNAM